MARLMNVAMAKAKLIWLPNQSILLCFLPVYSQKLLCPRPSWKILYTCAADTPELHNQIAPSADHVALHKNVIEIYQKVNGGISFQLTAQENGVRRHTMSHNFFVIFTPVRATSSVELYCTPLYNWALTGTSCTTAQCFLFLLINPQPLQLSEFQYLNTRQLDHVQTLFGPW
jgi:hypothetical protein